MYLSFKSNSAEFTSCSRMDTTNLILYYSLSSMYADLFSYVKERFIFLR